MKAINLMFHDVFREKPSESGFSGTGPDLYKISESVFDEILKYLSANRDKESYTLTFDDGGVSAYTIIAPLLEKYNFKGLFFIATGFIGEQGFLDKEQIADLDRRGHIIGSHSHTHKRLTSIPKSAVENEWRESKAILESIVGHPVYVASIPNGYQSSWILSEAKKCGFTDMYTSVPTCTVKSKESIRLHGRFVMMRDASVSSVVRLENAFVRFYLLVRARFLMFVQSIFGPYYKKIRNSLFR